MVRNSSEPFWTKRLKNKQSIGNVNSNHTFETILELFETVLNHKVYRTTSFHNYIQFVVVLP